MGAALYAKQHHGAIYGIGEGLQGSSYAIPTKGYDMRPLSLPAIAMAVARFKKFARANPNLTFQVTPIGCGLAGYKPRDIAPMFLYSTMNCQLPVEFLDVPTYPSETEL